MTNLTITTILKAAKVLTVAELIEVVGGVRQLLCDKGHYYVFVTEHDYHAQIAAATLAASPAPAPTPASVLAPAAGKWRGRGRAGSLWAKLPTGVRSPCRTGYHVSGDFVRFDKLPEQVGVPILIGVCQSRQKWLAKTNKIGRLAVTHQDGTIAQIDGLLGVCGPTEDWQLIADRLTTEFGVPIVQA